MEKEKKSQGRLLFALLAVVMLGVGVSCFFITLKTVVAVQYLVFFCLALYGAVLVTRYCLSEQKHLWDLVGGIFCVLVGGLVMGIQLFQSSAAAEGYMAFLLCVVLTVLSISLGVKRFSLAIAQKKQKSKKAEVLFIASALDVLNGAFLVVFSIFLRILSANIVLAVYFLASGVTMAAETFTGEKAKKQPVE